MVGSSLDDLDKTRLEQYFRRRFPDWSTPEDWAPTLAAHKLAAISEMWAQFRHTWASCSLPSSPSSTFPARTLIWPCTTTTFPTATPWIADKSPGLYPSKSPRSCRISKPLL